MYGALRALETFAQAVAFDAGCQVYALPSELNVSDAPRFAHRGLMIDTARHYEVGAPLRSAPGNRRTAERADGTRTRTPTYAWHAPSAP